MKQKVKQKVKQKIKPIMNKQKMKTIKQINKNKKL